MVVLDALTQDSIWKAVLGIAEARGIGVLVIGHDHALLAPRADGQDLLVGTDQTRSNRTAQALYSAVRVTGS